MQKTKSSASRPSSSDFIFSFLNPAERRRMMRRFFRLFYSFDTKQVFYQTSQTLSLPAVFSHILSFLHPVGLKYEVNAEVQYLKCPLEAVCRNNRKHTHTYSKKLIFTSRNKQVYSLVKKMRFAHFVSLTQKKYFLSLNFYFFTKNFDFSISKS